MLSFSLKDALKKAKKASIAQANRDNATDRSPNQKLKQPQSTLLNYRSAQDSQQCVTSGRNAMQVQKYQSEKVLELGVQYSHEGLSQIDDHHEHEDKFKRIRQILYGNNISRSGKKDHSHREEMNSLHQKVAQFRKNLSSALPNPPQSRPQQSIQTDFSGSLKTQQISLPVRSEYLEEYSSDSQSYGSVDWEQEQTGALNFSLFEDVSCEQLTGKIAEWKRLKRMGVS